MAATGDLKSPGREAVWVRVPPSLPVGTTTQQSGWIEGSLGQSYKNRKSLAWLIRQITVGNVLKYTPHY